MPDSDIATQLTALDGWTRDADEIVKTYDLPSFMDAIAFVERVAELAEAADHHPDIDIRYRKVRVGVGPDGVEPRQADDARSELAHEREQPLHERQHT
jgi:4a-hydroxytetrahydrobiopterin dehydratase